MYDASMIHGGLGVASQDVRLLYPDRHKDFIAVMSRHQDYSVHRVPSVRCEGPEGCIVAVG